MKTLYSWADLNQYGINALTGEACAYGQRLLCDLSEEGANLIKEFLGLSPLSSFPENWNSFVGNTPAIASIMLPRDCFFALAEFIGCYIEEADVIAIFKKYGQITFLSESDYNNMKEYLNSENGIQLRFNPKKTDQNVVNSRNVHEMSGRVI